MNINELKVENEEASTRGFFFIRKKDGRIAAELTYSKNGEEAIFLDHTVVMEEYQQQGIGTRLVEAAMDYAKRMDLKVYPYCPFAQDVIDEHEEEWEGLLHSEYNY